MTSTPHARATSTTPAPTSDDARLVACWLEPHWVSIVVAGVVIGRPAASHAVRVTLKLCSPTWLTQPPTTWPIGARVDARALDDRLLHDAEQLGGMDAGQAATAATDRGADGIDDDDGITRHGPSLRHGGDRPAARHRPRPGSAPGPVAAGEVGGVASRGPAASPRPGSTRSPRCTPARPGGRSRASGISKPLVGSRRHSSTLRSMTTAPGSSPSSRRFASGRMSTTRSPAAIDAGEVVGLDPVEAGPGGGEQVVDAGGHRPIVAASAGRRRAAWTARAPPRRAPACRRGGRSPSPAAAASRRGCSSRCVRERLATSWQAPTGTRPNVAGARARRSSSRPVDERGLGELAVDDDERPVGVAVVVQADRLPGRPAEQPDLVRRRRQQAAGEPARRGRGRRAGATAPRRGRGR